MAFYSINKRLRGERTVYSTSVKQKNKGKIVFSKSKTFTSRTSALKWARGLITQLEADETSLVAGYKEVSFGELIVEYENYKAKSNRPLGRTASFTYRIIRNYPISHLIASKIKSHDIVHYCMARKESESQPGPATIAIDVSLIRKVLRIGKSLLGVNCTQQPVIEAYQALYDLKLIARSTARKRRLEGNEYDKLLAFFEQKEQRRSTVIPYRAIFKISLATCLRISEVTSLRWEDLNISASTILVRDRKNPNGSKGNHTEIPLLGEALPIIRSQPRVSDFIFPVNPRSVTAGFQRACKKLGIVDLRYHDLRREAATRLIESGYTVEEVATVTGHKDLNILWQVYTQITPAHLLKKNQNIV
ncbi:site-specific integrase [Alteromonadaceae bacterium A_SAG3]|nr:site-specific integrase [Alteromonadaceae bacterium A_SAG8]NKX33446.1 site-specific integrase [Alteromonadaceae bacterium A_SAG3]